jgi:uncharacterized protein with GYD domain
MAKYAIFFDLRSESVKGMMERPSDRERVVSNLVSGVGGTLDAYYFMFGRWDGMVIIDAPDSRSAAAVSAAVSSTGAFGHIETHELFAPAAFNQIMEVAKGLTYFPPGG